MSVDSVGSLRSSDIRGRELPPEGTQEERRAASRILRIAGPTPAEKREAARLLGSHHRRPSRKPKRITLILSEEESFVVKQMIYALRDEGTEALANFVRYLKS